MKCFHVKLLDWSMSLSYITEDMFVKKVKELRMIQQ